MWRTVATPSGIFGDWHKEMNLISQRFLDKDSLYVLQRDRKDKATKKEDFFERLVEILRAKGKERRRVSRKCRWISRNMKKSDLLKNEEVLLVVGTWKREADFSTICIVWIYNLYMCIYMSTTLSFNLSMSIVNSQ